VRAKKGKKKTVGSWRSIRQSAREVKISSFARQRYQKIVLRTVGAGLLLVVLGVACWGAYRVVQEGSRKITSLIPSSPVGDIEFSTDGVVSDAWVIERIDLPEDIPLMEIDIHEVKNDLERHPQIRRAIVARRLPDRLSIRIEERMPMMRMAARDSAGRRVNLLVADDGVVYQGVGYNRALLNSLPYVAGVRLQREGGGFRALEGMAPVAELLNMARNEVPEIYASWRVVDCADLPLIRVTTDEISEIVFRNTEFPEQLAQLHQLLLHQRRNMGGMPYERVDLSLGGGVDVPVSLY
jgi:hypothetical protein